MRLSANAIEHFGGETLSLDADKRRAGRSSYFRRISLGVIAAITPFNDPLNLLAHKVGPALAAGNAIVVKPAEQTPFSALLLAQLVHDSGAPAGIISVLPGDVATGQALVEDSNIDAISFTGGGGLPPVSICAAGQDGRQPDARSAVGEPSCRSPHPPGRRPWRQGLLVESESFTAAVAEDRGSHFRTVRSARLSAPARIQGGRPPKFDATMYKGRNVVERRYARLQQWRGLATRYDTLAVVYRAALVLNGVIA